jgi:cellulose synthase/poly-beta-1,6-N-acetylglucosamine synthase-like glycosyltransferase
VSAAPRPRTWSRDAVSVVVCVRDGAPALPALFAGLAAQDVEHEVVVVDNGSRDRTADVARRLGAVVVDVPERRRGRARNAGALAADGALLAFTDAGCVPRPGWLGGLVGGLAEAELAAGPVVVRTTAQPNACERFEALWRFPQERNVRELGIAATANLGVRADALRSWGGFDAALHVGEDADLCLRAGARGASIAWCPEAAVEETASATLRAVARRGFDRALAQETLHRRHGLRPDRSFRHPGPLLRGDWVLRRFGIEPDSVPARERAAVLRVARVDYAARMAGSAVGVLRRG